MFVSGNTIGLKAHEEAAMRDLARAGQAAGYGALINAAPILDDAALREAYRPDEPQIKSPGGLMRPSEGVPPAMTYQDRRGLLSDLQRSNGAL